MNTLGHHLGAWGGVGTSALCLQCFCCPFPTLIERRKEGAELSPARAQEHLLGGILLEKQGVSFNPSASVLLRPWKGRLAAQRQAPS